MKRKTIFAILFTGSITISVFSGCDNNRNDSATGMDRSATSTSASTSGSSVGTDSDSSDFKTRGNLNATGKYHNSGSTGRTGSTTYSTASGTDSDASMRSTSGHSGGRSLKNQLFDKDGDGKLFNTRKRKKQRSPDDGDDEPVK